MKVLLATAPKIAILAGKFLVQVQNKQVLIEKSRSLSVYNSVFASFNIVLFKLTAFID